ncbi:hypothetical protein F4780DRAFT_770581 [Xylariomycetidae sp. FL0641]|nr:hypothetical protein F4780DRAFT_770581 [Xylariomycetidae sp. FL0641]
MRRSRTSSSPYRALAQRPANGLPDSATLIRSFNVETNPTRPIRPSPLTASTIPDMPLDMLDRMRSFPLFMSAPEEFLVAIGKHLRPQIHSAHDHVLTEGDEARAMYWLVRGVVAVTSRDGEAVHAELKPGCFFGEIGVLMNMPRTATIVARTKCLLLVLKKEDLQSELPKFPEMEKAIRHEAHERLAILTKKRRERGQGLKSSKKSGTSREVAPGEVSTGEVGVIKEGTVVNTKKRKSPSPGVIEDPSAGSALGSGLVNVRQTLKELPLFSPLSPDILHFLGMSAQPKTFPPFTDIIRQGTSGNEIYFVVRGEAEVVHETPDGQPFKRATRSQSLVRPRLRQGQYFGEVASLGLSLKRTATVRSITTVECLMISGEALEELWKRCPPGIREQKPDEDVEMVDADKARDAGLPLTPVRTAPQVTFTTPSKPASPDPDPFLSVDMENLRNRRRGSMAPPTPPSETPATGTPLSNGFRVTPLDTLTPVKFTLPTMISTSPISEGPTKKAKLLPTHLHSDAEQPVLPDDVMLTIFQYLDVVELMRLRQLSSHWRKVVSTSPKLGTHVDLAPYNRRVTDHVLVNIIAPFLGQRPLWVDGFSKLWKMRSVDNAKGLEEVDWSNCRKVGDNLLARVVGWVVPDHPPQATKQVKPQTQTITLPPPGTVIGCPKLKRLNLSYCKHITDRSMAHMAAHASNRLQSLSLTRCTSITDAGFQSWTPFRFTQLTHLGLADCTYLSDNAIVALVNAAKQLTHLDLSFCCALSDTATEVLRMAFCGSAVSDNSLACVALHLHHLERVSVRGCVRVTAVGIESADISQCRNLEGWRLDNGANRGAVIPPRGGRNGNRSARNPVAFVVEKGPGGLREITSPTMKQWITNQDGLDKLQLVDAPEPSELKDGEVLVKINRVSLNFRDTEVCMGEYGHHKTIQQGSNAIVPCSDMCGVVSRVGPGDAAGLQEGDRVVSTFTQSHLTGQITEKDMANGMGLPLPGVLTQARVFPATGLVKVPAYVTDEEAACLPIAAVTAWMGINTFQPMGRPLQGQDKVLLVQGTGGVSISGLQIGKALGLTTIVTSSSDAKLERARQLGADHTINYRTTPNWDERVLSLTDGKGADVIFECGGAQTLDRSFECVAFGGLISAIGYVSGKQEAPGSRLIPNVKAIKRNVTLKGLINGPKDRFEEMLGLYEKKQIRPVIDRVFEFEQADEALRYLFSGSHFGKVVVKVP